MFEPKCPTSMILTDFLKYFKNMPDMYPFMLQITGIFTKNEVTASS